MSQNIAQIFAGNPATTLQATDLFYLGRSPYATANDMAVQFSVLQTGLNALTNVNVTTATVAMVTNTSYTNNNASLTTFTLPVSSAVGDVLEVTGNGAGGWTIVFGTGQSVNVGSSIGTPTTGSVSSMSQNDSIYLKCVVANTQWNTLNAPQGNLTVV